MDHADRAALEKAVAAIDETTTFINERYAATVVLLCDSH
jgi:hypothetical protein